MYTIQIVGAGYTGAKIAQFFAAKKQKVFALTRSPAKAQELESQKISPIIADLTKPETLTKIPPAHFVVICPAPDESTENAYEKIYLKGVKNYLQAMQKNPRPSLIVYLSSSGVWDEASGELDENVQPQPKSKKSQILFEAEKQILNCGLPAIVLRLSGIYGPGRNRLQAFREGKWPSTKENRWMNLIHVDDIAEAMPFVFKNSKEGEIYLGTDNEPFLTSELVKYLTQKTGIPNKSSFEGQLGGRRLKNDKFKSLGIVLKYPTFREGYASFLTGGIG